MKEEWFKAIENNNINKVNELINQGIDVNIQNTLGYTALILTSYYGYNQIVELLLKHPNININIQNNYDNTALIEALYYRHEEIVKSLLKHPGIDINIQNNDGENFIDFFKYNSFLIDYQLQKEILNNDRDDIILFLDKYNLIHPNIKKENPDLFKANVWGLV